MKTIKFENIETREITDYQKGYSNRMKNSNGLYKLLKCGYSWHIPIEIRPDDILNNVTCIWAKYIVGNAEKFRDFFVDHEGKKKLTYCSDGSYSENRMPEFMAGLISLIKEDQSKDNMSWATADFTTTSDTDKFVRSTAMLASQKEYYEYGICLACGFPSITLLGTKKDWLKLLDSIVDMPALDQELSLWRDDLYAVVKKMQTDSEDFWQSCLTRHPYGSGSQAKIEGWITVFNPINENCDWISIIDDKDVLNLTADFDLAIDDNGNKFDLKIESGPTQIIENDGVLSVSNNFLIKNKADLPNPEKKNDEFTVISKEVRQLTRRFQ